MNETTAEPAVKSSLLLTKGEGRGKRNSLFPAPEPPAKYSGNGFDSGGADKDDDEGGKKRRRGRGKRNTVTGAGAINMGGRRGIKGVNSNIHRATYTNTLGDVDEEESLADSEKQHTVATAPGRRPTKGASLFGQNAGRRPVAGYASNKNGREGGDTENRRATYTLGEYDEEGSLANSERQRSVATTPGRVQKGASLIGQNALQSRSPIKSRNSEGGPVYRPNHKRSSTMTSITTPTTSDTSSVKSSTEDSLVADRQARKREAKTKYNLGLVKMKSKEYTRAKEFFSAAIDAHTELRGFACPDVAFAHEKIGSIAREEGDVMVANDHYMEALKALSGYELRFRSRKAVDASSLKLPGYVLELRERLQESIEELVFQAKEIGDDDSSEGKSKGLLTLEQEEDQKIVNESEDALLPPPPLVTAVSGPGGAFDRRDSDQVSAMSGSSVEEDEEDVASSKETDSFGEEGSKHERLRSVPVTVDQFGSGLEAPAGSNLPSTKKAPDALNVMSPGDATTERQVRGPRRHSSDPNLRSFRPGIARQYGANMDNERRMPQPVKPLPEDPPEELPESKTQMQVSDSNGTEKKESDNEMKSSGYRERPSCSKPRQRKSVVVATAATASYERGMQLFAEGDYAAAQEWFLDSLKTDSGVVISEMMLKHLDEEHKGTNIDDTLSCLERSSVSTIDSNEVTLEKQWSLCPAGMTFCGFFSRILFPGVQKSNKTRPPNMRFT